MIETYTSYYDSPHPSPAHSPNLLCARRRAARCKCDKRFIVDLGSCCWHCLDSCIDNVKGYPTEVLPVPTPKPPTPVHPFMFFPSLSALVTLLNLPFPLVLQLLKKRIKQATNEHRTTIGLNRSAASRPGRQI